MMGCQKLPPDMELIRTLPTMGPVQGERDQHEGERHEEDAAETAPLSDLVSVLFTRLLGIVMSNAPKTKRRIS